MFEDATAEAVLETGIKANLSRCLVSFDQSIDAARAEGDTKREMEDGLKLTYLAEDALYVARGYGEQPSGGYSIAVDDLYLSGTDLCIKTTLIGPAADEKVTTAVTYPFIVLKLQPMETEAHFLN